MEKEHFTGVNNDFHLTDECFIYALACSPIHNTILNDEEYILIESWFNDNISASDLTKAKELIKYSIEAKQHVLDLRMMLAATHSSAPPFAISQHILNNNVISKSTSLADKLASLFTLRFSFQSAAGLAAVVCVVYVANQYASLNREIPNNNYASNSNNAASDRIDQKHQPTTKVAENPPLKTTSNDKYEIAMADINIPSDTELSYRTVTRGAKQKYIPIIKQISVSTLAKIGKKSHGEPSETNDQDDQKFSSQFIRDSLGIDIKDSQIIVVDSALILQARKNVDNNESLANLKVRLVAEHDPYFKAISKNYPNYDPHLTIFLVEDTKFKPKSKDTH